MKKLLLFNLCFLQIGIFAAADEKRTYTSKALSELGVKLLGIEMSRNGSYAVYTHSTKNAAFEQPEGGEKRSFHSAALSLENNYHVTLVQTNSGEDGVHAMTSQYDLSDKPACLRFNNQATQLAIGVGTGERFEHQSKFHGLVALINIKDGKLKPAFTLNREDDFSKAEDLCFFPSGKALLKASTVFNYSKVYDRQEPIATCAKVMFYDFETGKGNLIATESNQRAGRCTISQDSRLCAAQIGNTIKLWDMRTSSTQIKKLVLSDDHTKDCFYFSPDNSTIYSSVVTSSDGVACMINLLSIGEGKITKKFDLVGDSTEEWQVSRKGHEFKVDMPACIKTTRACKKMIGDTKPAFACTNAAETILLYQEKDGEQVFLSKTS